MTKDPIVFENVSKKYRLGQEGYHSLREDIVEFFKGGRSSREHIWALKDVNFSVAKGKVLGIIGPNGSGKSTTLKLLAHITMPTQGRIEVTGRTAALIELGAGFHPELTGRENIYLNGSIVGMKKKEIDAKFDSIVDFADLAQFVDTPVKRYSSGMYARLGFAVSVHNEPEVLLIDEVLSVGDTYFQNKCFRKMDEIRKSDKTVVFISHNLDAVRNLCDETVLLNKGRLEMWDRTDKVIERYYQLISEQRLLEDSGQAGKKASITKLQLFNAAGQLAYVFKAGEEAFLRVSIAFHDNVDFPAFGFFVRRSDSLLVFDTTSKLLGIAGRCFQKGERITLNYRFRTNLLKGTYHIGNHIEEQDIRGYYDYVDNAVTFHVVEDRSYAGVANLHPECEMSTC